jgi:hypothetical protein
MKFATIFKEDLEYISRCILDYPDTETGGDFFGFWNNLGFPVIQYVTGQGIKSNQQVAFFQQDVDYLLKVSNAAYQSFGMQHIGSWHSHHKLRLARPSGHDSQTMANAINKNGLNQFFMILGNIQYDSTIVNGFLFDKENQCNYSETQWNILYEKNTFKKSIDKLVGNELYLPQTEKAKFVDLKLINNVKTDTVLLDSKPENEFEISFDDAKEQLIEEAHTSLSSDDTILNTSKIDIESNINAEMQNRTEQKNTQEAKK